MQHVRYQLAGGLIVALGLCTFVGGCGLGDGSGPQVSEEQKAEIGKEKHARHEQLKQAAASKQGTGKRQRGSP